MTLPGFEAYLPGCWAVTFRSRPPAVLYLGACLFFLAIRHAVSLSSAISQRSHLGEPSSRATRQ